MKREDLIRYIQFYLSTEQNSDPVVKTITTDDIETVIKQQCKSLNLDYEDLPPSSEGILICLTRKEIYWKLATASAPMYELNMDGLKVSKQTRFEHYLSLIQQVEQEYINLMNDPNRTIVSVGEALIQKPYTMDSYIKGYKLPKIDFNIDKVNLNNIELTMNLKHVTVKDYVQTELYIHTAPIIDKYDNNAICNEAKQVLNTTNIRQDCFRIPNLDTTANTYHILFVVKLKYGLSSYIEKEVIKNVPGS